MKIDDKKISGNRQIDDNTAGRLYVVLHALRGVINMTTVSQAWVTAAGGNTTDNRSDQDHGAVQVLRSISIALPELSNALAENNVPSELWAPYFPQLFSLAEVSLLHKEKQHTIGNLTSDLFLTLRWWAHVLPVDQVVADDSDIQELKIKLGELHEALQANGIPPALRRYATEQLQALSDALLLYSVRGLTPVRAAMRKAHIDAVYEQEDLRREIDSPNPAAPVRTLREKLGGALSTASKIASEGEKLVKAGEYLAGKGQQVWSAVQALIEQQPPNP